MKRVAVLLLVMLLWAVPVLAQSSVYSISGGNADRVHLRAEPSRDAKSLGLYYTGTDVILIDQANGWARVLVGDVTGYILTEYITQDSLAQLGPWCIVDNPGSTWVNLRMSPSMSGDVAMCPDNRTAVHVLGETADGWSYVECEGVKGYIVTGFLRPASELEAGRLLTVGKTTEGNYIHRYTAPGGQSIYFDAVEEQPPVTYRDVNFDGMTDIVVFVSMGASNFYAEFFIYDAGTDAYIRAEHPGIDYGICNYQLYPEYELVGSHASNGYAGALHEDCLFRWEGTNLKLVRRAVSQELQETYYDQGHDRYSVTTWNNILHITVRDYQSGGYEGDVIWEKTADVEDTFYQDVIVEERDALWQGIE